MIISVGIDVSKDEHDCFIVSSEGEGGMNRENILKLNKLIKKLADERKVSYLDVGAYLKNKDGYLDEEDSPDGYHIQPNACLRMVNAVKYLID